MDRKVNTAYLKVGMYVSKLDRPWMQTPFLIQGFFIEDKNEITALAKYCDFVYIDTELGLPAEKYMDAESEASPSRQGQSTKRMAANRQIEGILDTGEKPVDYVNKNTAIKELPEAKVALETASQCVARMVEHCLENGQLDIATVKAAIEPVLESMIRNSDAFMWLSKLRHHDAYSYERSIQNCALGIAFGRHMGLNRAELYILAMGVLLMDIGTIKLSEELLAKTEPHTPEEAEIMRKHVVYTVEILKKTKDINQHVINIAWTHHERYDGSGYPNGLVGIKTPAYGRIAAIIDCYDSMITTSSYREAISEHKALQNIYNSRDKSFQQELVEQFMQCMGVYPTGSLVELSSGAVAAVLSQNAEQKLKPEVVMLLDENKKPYKKHRVFDLSKQGKTPVHIIKSLENHTYGVDVKQTQL